MITNLPTLNVKKTFYPTLEVGKRLYPVELVAAAFLTITYLQYRMVNIPAGAAVFLSRMRELESQCLLIRKWSMTIVILRRYISTVEAWPITTDQICSPCREFPCGNIFILGIGINALEDGRRGFRESRLFAGWTDNLEETPDGGRREDIWLDISSTSVAAKALVIGMNWDRTA
jgi:hypothetical protein